MRTQVLIPSRSLSLGVAKENTVKPLEGERRKKKKKKKRGGRKRKERGWVGGFGGGGGV